MLLVRIMIYLAVVSAISVFFYGAGGGSTMITREELEKLIEAFI